MITRSAAAALLVGALLLGHHSAALARAQFSILHHERMVGLTLERRAGPAAAAGTRARAQRLRFDALGRAFDLALEPNDRLLAALTPDQRPAVAGLELYRATLLGEPGSWARMGMLDGRLHGLIWDGRELYAIEPEAALRERLVEPASARDEPIIFRLRDVQGSFGDDTLLGGPTQPVAADQQATLFSELGAARGVAAVRRLDLGLVADLTFARQHAGAEAQMLLRANVVDGIFSEQAGVQLNVAALIVHATEPDPFASADPDTLLESLGRYRTQTASLRSLGLTHLLTGRELDGSTIGLAYVNGVCSAALGAGITQTSFSVFRDALVTAHEIAHNLGARHDAEAGSPCAATPPTYLMAPQLSGNDRFSQCSLDRMAQVIAAAGCLHPVIAGDVGVGLELPARALLGDGVTARIAVDNLSASPVINGVLTLTTGLGVALQQVRGALSQGCTIDGAQLHCAMAGLAAGAHELLELDLLGTRVGSVSVQASIEASNDPVSANDTVARELVFEPAVVLEVAVTPAALALRAGAAQAIEVRVRNASVLNATAVELDVDSPFELTDLGGGATRCTRLTPARPRYRCEVGTVLAGMAQALRGTLRAPSELGAGASYAGTLSITATAAEALAQPESSTAQARIETYAALVDLASRIRSAPQRIDPGKRAHIVVELANLGPDAAPDAQLRVEFPAGLEVATAADPRAACTREGPAAVRCWLASLRDGELLAVDVEVVAVRAGRYDWMARATHRGLDPNASNDAAAASLEVAAATGAGASDGPATGAAGGGGASWSLLLLALAARAAAVRLRG